MSKNIKILIGFVFGVLIVLFGLVLINNFLINLSKSVYNEGFKNGEKSTINEIVKRGYDEKTKCKVMTFYTDKKELNLVNLNCLQEKK